MSQIKNNSIFNFANTDKKYKNTYFTINKYPLDFSSYCFTSITFINCTFRFILLFSWILSWISQVLPLIFSSSFFCFYFSKFAEKLLQGYHDKQGRSKTESYGKGEGKWFNFQKNWGKTWDELVLSTIQWYTTVLYLLQRIWLFQFHVLIPSLLKFYFFAHRLTVFIYFSYAHFRNSDN